MCILYLIRTGYPIKEKLYVAANRLLIIAFEQGNKSNVINQ